MDVDSITLGFIWGAAVSAACVGIWFHSLPTVAVALLVAVLASFALARWF